MLALSLCGVLYYISDRMNAVYIRDGESTILHYTLSEHPDEILKENGIATMAFDMVDFSGFAGKLGVISIKRAFPVTVHADGETFTRMTTEKTVNTLLHEEEITLGHDDMINLPPQAYLSPGDRIEVQRVTVNRVTQTETIDYQTEYKDSGLLRNGQTRVLYHGAAGERELVYVERTVDGVVQERNLVNSNVTKAPKDAVVLRGSREPISQLDFGVALDENGVPVKYKKLLTNQICTGYSAFPGARGASRMRLDAGYVAVRANEIPYGTKMYITSADGKFVYGFAIAADTGTGLMENIIDFDLYYNSYLESALTAERRSTSISSDGNPVLPVCNPPPRGGFRLSGQP
jgi:3D (Asp-Asp-Asp) domain-containing protein